MRYNKLTPGANLIWKSSKFMLHEHVDKIKDLHKAATQKTKPILDDFRLRNFHL